MIKAGKRVWFNGKRWSVVAVFSDGTANIDRAILSGNGRLIGIKSIIAPLSELKPVTT